jgi:hypothetical protein
MHTWEINMSVRDCDCKKLKATALCKTHYAFFCPMCYFEHATQGGVHLLSKVENALTDESFLELEEKVATRIRAIENAKKDAIAKCTELTKRIIEPFTSNNIKEAQKYAELGEDDTPQSQAVRIKAIEDRKFQAA